MRYRTTLVLFAALLVLSGVYFGYLKPMAEQRAKVEDFESRFFRSDPAEVDLVRVDAGNGAVEVVRIDGKWKIRLSKEHDADEGMVDKLFDTLSRGRIVKVVGDISDKARFGLDKPGFVLGVAHEEYLDIIKIGDKNPSESGFYASSEKMGKIFLLEREFVKDLYLQPQDLRMKSLYDVQPEGIGKVRVEWASGVLELTRAQAEGWKMSLPIRAKVDAPSIESFISNLSLQKVEAYMDWDPELATNLGEPIRLEIFDKDGASLGAYDAYYWGTEGNRGTLIHSPGSREASRARRDFFEILQRDPSIYMYRKLLPLEPSEVVSLALWSASEGELKLKRNDNVWSINGREVRPGKVESLIEGIGGLEAVRLINEQRALGKPRWRVDLTTTNGGNQWFEVSDFNMDHEVSSSSMFATVEPGKPLTRKVDFLYTRASGLAFGAVASSEDMLSIFNMAWALSNEAEH